MAMLRFCGSFGDCDKMPEAINWRRGKFDEFDLGTVSDIFVYGWLHSLAMQKHTPWRDYGVVLDYTVHGIQ